MENDDGARETVDISYARKGDIGKMIPPPATKNQSLAGFDGDYVDIVDYIVRCTHKIWEEGGLGRIYTHYQHNATVWTSDGMSYSREEVIAASAQTQAAFPDGKLYTDDVIWAGNDVDGFHTSHRIMWVGHNTGYTVYGPPTGRKMVRTGIANCFVRENRVIEEWIARDEISLVLQLGFDPNAIAERYARAAFRGELPRLPNGNVERVAGQTTPAPLPPAGEGDFDPEDFVRRAIHEIWNWRYLHKIQDYYSPVAITHTAGRRDLYGYGDLRTFILSLIAAFPDCAMSVDHTYHIGNLQDGYRVACRWTLHGHHRGYGPYGAPTGGPIKILGVTHFHIKGGQITEEWMLFDELAIYKQVWLARVAAGA
ncbi:MAG TPA: ester cyclase [Anaerolineae bacterium]